MPDHSSWKSLVTMPSNTNPLAVRRSAKQARNSGNQRKFLSASAWRSDTARAFDRPQDGLCLVQALLVLTFRYRIGNNPRACLDIADAIFHQHGANRDAGIEIAGVVGVTDAAAVDAAPCRLQLLNDLHRTHLGRTGERAGREAGAKRVDRGEFRT